MLPLRQKAWRLRGVKDHILLGGATPCPRPQFTGKCRWPRNYSERRFRLRRCIVSAPYALVEVNRGSRHHAGLIAGQERNGACHLDRIEQSAEGLPRGGFLQPARRPTVIDLLGVEFTFRGHPAN